MEWSYYGLATACGPAAQEEVTAGDRADADVTLH